MIAIYITTDCRLARVCGGQPGVKSQRHHQEYTYCVCYLVHDYATIKYKSLVSVAKCFPRTCVHGKRQRGRIIRLQCTSWAIESRLRTLYLPIGMYFRRVHNTCVDTRLPKQMYYSVSLSTLENYPMSG